MLRGSLIKNTRNTFMQIEIKSYSHPSYFLDISLLLQFDGLLQAFEANYV